MPKKPTKRKPITKQMSPTRSSRSRANKAMRSTAKQVAGKGKFKPKKKNKYGW